MVGYCCRIVEGFSMARWSVLVIWGGVSMLVISTGCVGSVGVLRLGGGLVRVGGCDLAVDGCSVHLGSRFGPGTFPVFAGVLLALYTAIIDGLARQFPDDIRLKGGGSSGGR